MMENSEKGEIKTLKYIGHKRPMDDEFSDAEIEGMVASAE